MASSSSGAELFLTSNCSHCSKINMKRLNCPGLAGRGRHGNFAGLPLHPQVMNRTPSQCCCPTNQPVFPAFPVRLNSLCICSQYRSTNEPAERRVPVPHPHTTPGNSCWINPLDIRCSHVNSGFPPNALSNQPCLPPGHMGMATMTPVESLHMNAMSAYHHHHHFHHFHYHHHTHSRSNLHPYALPVLHPRLRRQTGIHQTSRHDVDGEQIPHNFIPIITSDARMTWEGSLNTDQLENVVNFGDQLVEQKPRGLSKSVLENLPTYRITCKEKEVGDSRCVVCLMDFEEKQQVRILPCLHEYHSKCIDKWLKSNRTCPICRKEIKIS